MKAKQVYKFSLRKQMALFITVVAIITYSMSAIFIYLLYPAFFENFNQMGFTIITLSAGVIWSSVIAFLAAGFVTKPLQKLERVALKAADGDIREDAEISKIDDEIRSLGIAFNHMLFNLRNMVLNIDENFKETNEKVNTISAASSKAAEQADGISRTIHEIALGADTSAVSIQNTAESVEEISVLARGVQERARSSEQVSIEMVTELIKSKDVIRSLTAGIQKLAEDNEDSLVAVQRLAENAKKVEQIIQLVGNIAAQTSLLALNASIEAARAGDHGKGFAVVAEEVRLLADESASAVQGISELIRNIQQDVQSVVTKISDQVKIANKEAEKGKETNVIIEEMTKTVHEVAEAVQEITSLVDQQMKRVEDTSMLSQEVAAIAEETSAGAGEVSAATVEQTDVMENVEKLAMDLQKQADQLKQTITRFKM